MGGAGMGSGRTAVPEWAVPEWAVPEWGLAKGMVPEGGMGYETF